MGENVSAVKARIQGQASASFAHGEYGIEFGFHEVEERKSELLSAAESLASRVERVADRFDPATLEFVVEALSSAVGTIESIRGRIDGVLREGVTRDTYPNQRRKLLAGATEEIRQSLRTLREPETLVTVREFRAVLDPVSIGNVAEAARIQLDQAASLIVELEGTIGKLRNQALEKAVAEGASGFHRLASSHSRYQTLWFRAVVASVALTVAAVAWAVFGTVADGGSTAVITAAVKHILAITAAAVITKACLAKYNVERHLKILYDHRLAVLTQFTTFEASIGAEDPGAKNQFRLEVAKFLFTDPQTGYASEGQSEFNVSPVINLVERATTKGG